WDCRTSSRLRGGSPTRRPPAPPACPSRSPGPPWPRPPRRRCSRPAPASTPLRRVTRWRASPSSTPSSRPTSPGSTRWASATPWWRARSSRSPPA
ncbi:MAG: hypothetical protein AVDCRST_MAG06-3189, partial [uncultured Nocardioides sp.]